MNYEGMEASEQLRTLVNGFRVSQALHVAAVLGVSDVLAGGPVSVEGLAGAVEADPDSLRRLLRALAAVGVYAETESGDFANSELSEALRAGVPGTVNAWATFIGEPYYWQSWGHLLHSIRTGQNAFRSLYGTDVWTYRAGDPARAAVFDAAMTGLAAGMAAAVAAGYEFPESGVVVDVGGGHGALLAELLEANPSLTGVLFDQPHVIAGAGQALADEPARRRITFEGGDMFNAVPSGADVYVFKSVLHDWPDDDCRSILQVCRGAMTPASVILIIERLLDGPNQGADTKFLRPQHAGHARRSRTLRGRLRAAGPGCRTATPSNPDHEQPMVRHRSSTGALDDLRRLLRHPGRIRDARRLTATPARQQSHCSSPRQNRVFAAGTETFDRLKVSGSLGRTRPPASDGPEMPPARHTCCFSFLGPPRRLHRRLVVISATTLASLRGSTRGGR